MLAIPLSPLSWFTPWLIHIIPVWPVATNIQISGDVSKHCKRRMINPIYGWGLSPDRQLPLQILPKYEGRQGILAIDGVRTGTRSRIEKEESKRRETKKRSRKEQLYKDRSWESIAPTPPTNIPNSSFLCMTLYIELFCRAERSWMIKAVQFTSIVPTVLSVLGLPHWPESGRWELRLSGIDQIN